MPTEEEIKAEDKAKAEKAKAEKEAADKKAADEAASRQDSVGENSMDEPVFEDNPEMEPDAVEIDEGQTDMPVIPGYPPDSETDDELPGSDTDMFENSSDSEMSEP